MIVKDEAHVIARCLQSVRPLIDHWVIVDTGSTDGTQRLIRELLHDIPGTLHERPWKNFGHNRSEAVALARGCGDYLLFVDADDWLEFEPAFESMPLDADAYLFEIVQSDLVYFRICLVNNHLPWRWVGVLHEYPECELAVQSKRLSGVRIRFGGDGGRSRTDLREKYARDAAVLEAAMRDDPTNARHQFYLAQSYRDSGQIEAALVAYERRSEMDGFAEESFCALLQAARMARRLGRSSAEVIDRYLRAHESRPTRAEALGDLASYLREIGPRWPLAHLFAERAIRICRPQDVLFVEKDWYDWRCLDEYSIAAYWVGDYGASQSACEQLLQSDHVPPSHVARVRANLGFAERALAASRR